VGNINDSTITQTLLAWFRESKRDLPWRLSYNPYHIWISEIMLQQTQMERGVSYFLRWIERFPDVSAVAEASEQQILKNWQGLGYYARARNLHRAAKIMAREFSGIVPCDYKTLLALPGIGPYTAAAIASIAGNSDIAVVDANVNRVYARLFDIDLAIKSTKARKKIKEIAVKLLPAGRARHFNQALMDFGALICTPRSPQCQSCPLRDNCLALARGTVAHRPLNGPKKKIVYLHKVAGLIYHKERIYIQQRQPETLWGGLWEFPGGEIPLEENKELAAEYLGREIFEETGLSVSVKNLLASVKHQYTHHSINLDCYLCKFNGVEPLPVLRSASQYQWVTAAQLEEYGFPAGPRKILESIRQFHPHLLKILS
jgi:A/G-specific adenine glycosylase